ncbi:zinc finger protein [Gracilaria domingensis]|nr:zinc finger protein [Gracilaria domingensis]
MRARARARVGARGGRQDALAHGARCACTRLPGVQAVVVVRRHGAKAGLRARRAHQELLLHRQRHGAVPRGRPRRRAACDRAQRPVDVAAGKRRREEALRPHERPHVAGVDQHGGRAAARAAALVQAVPERGRVEVELGRQDGGPPWTRRDFAPAERRRQLVLGAHCRQVDAVRGGPHLAVPVRGRAVRQQLAALQDGHRLVRRAAERVCIGMQQIYIYLYKRVENT